VSGYGDLARLVKFRPLSTPLPGPTYGGTYRSPFSAPWSSTVELLAREIKHLRPRMTVLEIDMREQDFRNDGLPRADRNAQTPGVILSLLGTPHGDLRYPAHAFHGWQDNVRALALALEALRKVDRYGVTKRGEQYAGWKALPSGSGPSIERGQALIREHGSVRAALMATHPDRGGDAADFADVQAARDGGGS
jgi:hypothetical protein